MVEAEQMAGGAMRWAGGERPPAGIELKKHIGSRPFVKIEPKLMTPSGNGSPMDTCRNSEVSMSDRLQFTLVNLVLGVVILPPLCYITYNIVVSHFDHP